MELHVLKQKSANVTPDSLVRSIKRAQAIISRTTAQETYLDGATAYTSQKYPDIPAANVAMDLRLPDASATAEAVLAEVDAHFAKEGVTCQLYECSEMNWPASLVELLKQRGLQPITRQVHQLLRYQPAQRSSEVQVIPGRAAYGEVRKLYEAHAKERSLRDSHAKQRGDAIIDQLDDARVDLFLARRSRAAVGAASVLTLGNIGVILDWFVLQSEVGTQAWQTLASWIIDHCQRAQFEQVLICLNEGDPRIASFEAMGFVCACRYESYQRSPR